MGTSEAELNRQIDDHRQDPRIQQLEEAMNQLGCKVDRSFFQARVCPGETEGGFEVPTGVVLCSNHISPVTVKQTMTHELIHAYDYCRAANLDWSDCDHHACSEIRAASLSGDCTWTLEVMRGNVFLGDMEAHHKKCVKRRAELSVAMNPNCGGHRARNAVSRMFEKCFQDTAPFDKIPY
mmetsp:Transcript_41808/g.50685  ORF Transcript_41808/g.50685 Transcript_41808/m.50685 type:complete len:180 (+) Transcript_41808:334-873(+)|eukprot:CAMPEP_0197865054 /NCGR_PEP_ID=MMETSP1438-20131217/43444_1 /TAXON_ID=1461541 /ORGANISM="Pterosperma sp., Strain CCMP1384" /LENGTH=179 /DNA_ID=CAMNT_0043483461 /DNA_START=316 /DNA_END=855 /DNA_ORIENTATION=-